MYQTWGILDKKMSGGEYRTLVHPCSMKKNQLRKLIPHSFDVDDVLDPLPTKQKEIARRLNISKLPSDRPSGMLGQTALFEIMRNKGFDFKRYLDGFYDNWKRSHQEGHALLFTLGYIYYIRRFFGYTPIDLVSYLLEPVTRYQLAITWDENWLNRILTNIFSVTPDNLSNKQIHQVLRKLTCIQDGWGATVSRVTKWTGSSRTDASHLVEIMRSSWMEHYYRIVCKNTGTVKVLTKSQSKWTTVPSHFSYCRSLKDDEGYFISFTDIVKNDAEGKYYELEAMNMNVELYDLKEKVWRINPSPHVSQSVDDIHAILQNGDHTVPDNTIQPTRRDLLFIAILTGMNTSHHPNKRKEIMEWFTKGYEIPKEEAEYGVRNVLRKNMVRNQYTYPAFMDLEREFFTITFDDKSKKVIPFLGDVLPNLPFFSLQTDVEMSYGHIFEYHPSHLSCEMRNIIESSMKEHDVNGELFVLHSWGYGYPGSILQLVPDE